MFLIDDLRALPVSGFKFVLRTLQQGAEEQFTDSARGMRRLLKRAEQQLRVVSQRRSGGVGLSGIRERVGSPEPPRSALRSPRLASLESPQLQ